MKISCQYRRWVTVWLLEFCQNLPFIIAFFYGFMVLSDKNSALMAVVVIPSVVIGALVIRYTEPFIVEEEVEKSAETLTNIVAFSTAIILIIYYFRWAYSSLLLDCGLGIITGTGIGLLQSKAEGLPAKLKHLLALSAAFTSAMVFIRLWGIRTNPILASLVLGILVTTIIVLVDYRKTAKHTKFTDDQVGQ